MINARPAVIAGFLGVLLSSSCYAQNQIPPLMSPVDPTLDLDPSQEAILAAIRSDPSVVGSEIITFKVDALASGLASFNARQIFGSELSEDVTLSIQEAAHPPSGPWDLSYYAVSHQADMQEADFAVDRGATPDFDQVSGTVVSSNRIYSIVPLGDGMHALVEHDPAAFPPDHEEDADDYAGSSTGSPTEDLESGPIDDERAQMPYNTPTVMRRMDALEDIDPPDPAEGTARVEVVVGFTEPAGRTTGDPLVTAGQMVASMNASLQNNNLTDAVEIHLADAMRINEPDPATYREGISQLLDPNDGRFDDLHAEVHTRNADIGVLIVATPGACGRAGKILADRDAAFALVKWSCALAKRSFAHELGHIFGARHDIDNDPTAEPFPYGHGFRHAGGGWRTIMAYDCNTGACPRGLYWSDPNAQIDGEPAGDVNEADNARVIRETSQFISSLRPITVTDSRNNE